MSNVYVIGMAATALLIGCGSVAAQGLTPTQAPLDQETVVSGFDVACTGIGQTRDQKRWNDYPVKVEFAGPSGDYLAGETLMLTRSRHPVLSLSCNAPWILMKLPPGETFKAKASMFENDRAGPRSLSIEAPRKGHRTFTFVFPKSHT